MTDSRATDQPAAPAEREFEKLRDDAIYKVISEHDGECPNFIDAFRGCTNGQSDCMCYALALAAWQAATAALTARLVEVERERDEAIKLVYVPGMRRCAKCKCTLTTTNLHAQDGSFSANNEPQDCPNGCGPMWPVTERQSGNELVDRLDAAQARIAELEGMLAEAWAVIAAAQTQFDPLVKYRCEHGWLLWHGYSACAARSAKEPG